MRIRRTSTTLLIAAVALSQLGTTDCDGTITRDSGFDLWCSETLCAWKVERGDIRRAATWHRGDAGVELLGSDTAIEQFTPVDFFDGSCIRFELIADVDEAAQVELNVDIYGDGSVERTFPLPTARFRPLSYVFAVEPPFTGIRFELAKRGSGHAVVARMRAAVVTEGCSGAPALNGGPAPLAAYCRGNADCETELCYPAEPTFGQRSRCVSCDPLHPSCGPDEVCGLAEPGPPERDVPLACVAAGARVLGERCITDRECATALCTLGRCSTCRADAATCAAGQACDASAGGPFLCGAGRRLGAPGAPCGAPEDCASSQCRGELARACSDGRTCASDANCPVDSTLRPTSCVTVGIQGGSCQ